MGILLKGGGNIKRKILTILLLLFIGLVFYQKTTSDFNSIDTSALALTEDANSYKVKKVLKEETANSDIIGSLSIFGTNINEILVQGSDNDYYLSHNYKKEKSTTGSIYLDYRNSINDQKLLIYGHNSKTHKKALFHELEKYLDANFYHENPYIKLNIDNKESIWQIFSIMIIASGDNRHMKVTFNDLEWIEHLSWLKENSVYETKVEVGVNDKIITLQTCYYKPAKSYLVISAKKI